MFTRPGRLHRRIEGQQIGLKRNFLDHLDDTGNFRTRFADAVHRIGGLFHDPLSVANDTGRLGHQVIGLVSVVGIGFGHRGGLFQGRGRFLQTRGLFTGPRRQSLGRVRHFV